MLLLVEVGMRVAQGISGDLEHAFKRLTQFQYEEDNATNRQRTNKEKYENRCVSRSDQPVAGERDREPEYDDDKERHGTDGPPAVNTSRLVLSSLSARSSARDWSDR